MCADVSSERPASGGSTDGDPAARLLARLQGVPVHPLVADPTPLEHMQRLSDRLGIELYIKRDDLTGIGGGGNKLRKLEHIMGEALQQGVDTLITTGGPQSNHARLTAAAAARAGLRAYLVLKGKPPGRWAGNLLLDRLFGADVTFADRRSWQEIDQDMQAMRARLLREGRKPLIVPLGGATAAGTAGYTRAVAELHRQCEQLALEPDYIVLAAGTGSTCAGLMLGLRALDSSCELIAISVSRTREVLTSDISNCVSDAGRLLGMDTDNASFRVRVEDGYVGPGYAIASQAGQRALRLVARTEGILLDSTYTAKAFSGLLDLVQRDVIRRGSRVVFWHTGGSPELYSHPLSQLLR